MQVSIIKPLSNLYWIQDHIETTISPWLFCTNDYTIHVKFRKKRNEPYVEKWTYCENKKTHEKFRTSHPGYYSSIPPTLWVHETGTFGEFKPIVNSSEVVHMDAYRWMYVGQIVQKLDTHTYIIQTYEGGDEVHHIITFEV